ncbi:class I SAM-dependent methyltransferase [Methylobacterium sp. WL2]|nr:class I SAM-dependent methyltransferase [Methylobacterium sp. WL1]TXN54209.1 class I SAM-dependent methyltransferase [Methylobacterium sp. WL2]
MGRTEPRRSAVTSCSNRTTLSSYAAKFRQYGERSTQTLAGASKTWIDQILIGLEPDAAIFEMGTAHGRDAAYIAARGYAVLCSDAVPEFVAELLAKGVPAIVFDLLTDPFERQYDLILANAVLLHFTDAEFDHALLKTVGALSAGGRFAFTLKAGQGSEWSNAKIDAPRYFRYWSRDELIERFDAHGLRDFTIDAVTTDRAHAEWIYVTVRRPAAGTGGA